MIHFRKINSPDPVARYLADTIAAHLAAGERVLWLVAGGSAVEVAVAAARRLAGQAQPLGRLTVTLTDERYGPPGHPDSNWQQLLDAGFAVPSARLLPVLTGSSQPATAEQWGREVDAALAAADWRLGFFGIGPDGHTSGILPHTAATAATGIVYAYDGGKFQRITTTAAAIARLDEAIVYAVGEAKWPVLDAFERAIDPADQPAQFLKPVPILTIFNDRKGELA